MQVFRNRVLAGSAVALLGVAGLMAQQAPAQAAAPQVRAPYAQGPKRLRAMAKVLDLTPDQLGQARGIFQEAGQSAKPVRMQVRETRSQLQAAIKSGDANQIQQLSSTLGGEQGQLAAIRATSMSKLYKILTPEQQQKLMAFHQAMKSTKKVPN